MTKKYYRCGFTLVELAIVMTIIGLLIGGILKGQELLQNARVTTVIAQIKGYQSALSSFEDIYGGLPGDFRYATVRLPCAAGACTDGNADGSIGATMARPDASVPIGITTENTQFWRHLALANLVSGVNTTATSVAFGQTMPMARTGGGFFAATTSMAAGVFHPDLPDYNGLQLTLRRDPDGTAGGAVCAPGDLVCAVSPISGSMIDRKIDDGVAMRGDVHAYAAGGWANGCGTVALNGPQGYNNAVTRPVCDMYILIRK